MSTFLARVNIGKDFKLGGGKGIAKVEGLGSIREFISVILPNVFIVAGIILLILIIAGGIGMITTAGNPEAREKSKGTLTNAIIGFVIIFASYWIIQIIQVLTGVGILRDFN